MKVFVFLPLLVSLTSAGHPYSGHFKSGTPHLLFGPKTGVFPLKELNSDIIGPLVLGNKIAAIIVGRDNVGNIPKDFSGKGRIDLQSVNFYNQNYQMQGANQQFQQPAPIKQSPEDFTSSTGGVPYHGPLPLQQNINQQDRTNPWARQIRSEPFLGIRQNALPLGLMSNQRKPALNFNFAPGPFRTFPTVGNLRNMPNSIADSIIQRVLPLFQSRLQVPPNPILNISPDVAAATLRRRFNLGPLSFLRSQLLKVGRLGMGQVLKRFALQKKLDRQAALPGLLTGQMYGPFPVRPILW